MTNQTPAYWVVIYTADDWNGPLISAPMWAKTPEEASHRTETARQGRTAQNTVGPFTDQVEAESYRRTWAMDQGRTTKRNTTATLLEETASVIYTEVTRNREGRTPAQNAALPPTVSLYGAMNIVICGDPDDTRGNRDGVNSADLVRTFAGFLNVSSPLEWSRERTSDEIVTALRACASSLRTPTDSADSDVFDLLERSGADLDDPKWSGMDAFDVAETLASVHEHDPIACAPEFPADTTATESTVWAITAESFGDTDKPMPAETFVRISDMDAVIRAHRASGASVEVSWPFGSDGTGTPTYVHVYVYADVLGVTTYRRANPSEVSQTETETVTVTVTETTDTTAPAGVSETDDTMVFLERQNRALEAFRSGITQGIHMNRDKAKGMGPDAKTSAGAVVEFLSDLLKQAEREYDRQMKL